MLDLLQSEPNYEDSKTKMFTRAKNLIRVLGLQQDDPILTPDMAFRLMEYLDRMHVDVNPKSPEFGLETVLTTPEMIAKLVEVMEPGHGICAAYYGMGIPFGCGDHHRQLLGHHSHA